MNILYCIIAVVLLSVMLYGSIGCGINLGRRGCRQTSPVTFYCMIFGMFGLVALVVYLTTMTR